MRRFSSFLHVSFFFLSSLLYQVQTHTKASIYNTRFIVCFLHSPQCRSVSHAMPNSNGTEAKDTAKIITYTRYSNLYGLLTGGKIAPSTHRHQILIFISYCIMVCARKVVCAFATQTLAFVNCRKQSKAVESVRWVALAAIQYLY